MKKVYVGNLSFKLNDADLSEVFEASGTIVSARIIKDRATDRSKGFGFVEFETEAEAKEALKLDGQEFEGRPLKVSLAREQRPRQGGGGGRHHSGGERERW